MIVVRPVMIDLLFPPPPCRAIVFLFVQGLSDDSELVRDVAMRSGQAIVMQHAVTHSHVLVPPLRQGECRCFHPSSLAVSHHGFVDRLL